MTAPSNPDDPDKREPLEPFGTRLDWLQRRREKIVAEIQANRRGEYRVPTWVLTACLAVLLLSVVLLLVLL
jgi:uncharacterized membrane protein YdfJ with MMPL/SSD domain